MEGRMDRRPRCPELSGGKFRLGDETYYENEICNLNGHYCITAAGDDCEAYQDYLKWLDGEEDEE